MEPLLFILFINLPEYTSSDVKLIADDCLFYYKINSIADAEQLQRVLKSFKKWGREWQNGFSPPGCVTSMKEEVH